MEREPGELAAGLAAVWKVLESRNGSLQLASVRPQLLSEPSRRWGGEGSGISVGKDKDIAPRGGAHGTEAAAWAPVTGGPNLLRGLQSCGHQQPPAGLPALYAPLAGVPGTLPASDPAVAELNWSLRGLDSARPSDPEPWAALPGLPCYLRKRMRLRHLGQRVVRKGGGQVPALAADASPGASSQGQHSRVQPGGLSPDRDPLTAPWPRAATVSRAEGQGHCQKYR